MRTGAASEARRGATTAPKPKAGVSADAELAIQAWICVDGVIPKFLIEDEVLKINNNII